MQWPIRDPGSRAAKSRLWVKFRFLDQIAKGPCQPDMSLGFILSLRIYSDGHCTKPDVRCSHSRKSYIFCLSISLLKTFFILCLNLRFSDFDNFNFSEELILITVLLSFKYKPPEWFIPYS